MSDQEEDRTEYELERTRQVVAASMAEQIAANDQVTGDVPAEDVEADVEGWDAYTKEELQDELRARGLPTSGNKDELIARLEES